MNRPPSIVAFERLYLGSILLTVVNAIVFWSFNRNAIAAMPQVQESPGLAALINIMLVVSLAITVAVSLLFWWLVARVGSVVGKWLVIVTEGLGVLFAILPLLNLIRGHGANVPGTIVTLVCTALAAAAAAMLFRADADDWIAAREDEAAPVA